MRARSARAALLLAGAALVAWHWLRLEEAPGLQAAASLMVVLGLAPALAVTMRARVAAALAAVPLAAAAALDVSPLHPGTLASRLEDGILGFYDVELPFARAAEPPMHGTVLVAIFAACLGLGLAVAARRPLVAVVVLLVGAGWPATLLPGGDDLLRGALVLATLLGLLAGLDARRRHSAAAGAAAVVVLAGLALGSLPSVAGGGFLEWRGWDLYTAPQTPVSVDYVWDADYGGIRFPAERTVVLKVSAPPTSTYFRATTLEAFDDDRWQRTRGGGARVDDGRSLLTVDPLLPPRAARRAGWLRQRVTVAALRDDHVVGASVPVAYDATELGDLDVGSDGVVTAAEGLRRGQRYTVWSFAAQPSPSQLARTRADYPRGILAGPSLTVAGGGRVPPFGIRGREAVVRRVLGGSSPYRALYARARTVARRAANPYAATVALESWFRLGGGFHYDERPPPSGRTPPLVDFVLRSRRGYCQYYAGSMALMLRLLGVPARVAAGFTSGSYSSDSGVWTVTDHEAHAWVEVWFPGYGWLPFDPTPGRGRLSGTYTTASEGYGSALPAGLVAAGGAIAGGQAALRLAERFGFSGKLDPPPVAGGAASAPAGPAPEDSALPEALSLLTALLLAIFAAVGAAKVATRRLRARARDPRRVAAAARAELAGFLRDQRIELAPSATLEELGRTVQSRLAVDAAPFVAAASEARYGAPAHAAAAAGRTRAELRLLLRGLRSVLPLRRRLLGYLSLRSLRLGGP